MLSLLSINGNLGSLFDQATVDEEERSTIYTEIDVGKPITIRYLRFSLRWEGRGDDVMISTFVKTKEEKPGAAEAINYFNPDTPFADGRFDLVDFGGEHYGHELIYYSKAYLGESVRLTSKVMELDRVNNRVVKAIREGLGTVAGLPTFSSYLSYAALASAGVRVFERLVNLFNRDDVIIDGHDLDLHFRRNHARRLQAGRIVCLPHLADVDGERIAADFSLDQSNRLISVDGANEFNESSYFVIQIDGQKNSLYEDFDYFKNAAEMLSLTNRGGDPTEIVASVVNMAKAYNDVDSIRRIEELSLDLDDEENKKLVKALNKSLSPDIRKLYEDRIKELLGEE